MRALTAALLALLISVLAADGLATDGVFEINATIAAAGGLAVDPPGFPVVISSAGSYRLTGNLLVPDGNTTAVLVTAGGVSFDLGGFEIRGPNSCTTPPVTCTHSGTGFGVDALVANVHVFNGRVTGMGSSGLRLGERARVDDLVVAHNGGGINGGNGIEMGRDGAISNVIAEQNRVAGIVAGDGSRIESTISNSNGHCGMVLDRSSIVRRSSAIANSSCGIYGNSGSQIVESLAARNGGSGLIVEGQGEVRDSFARGNSKCGVAVGVGSHVAGIASIGNTISPLHFTAGGPEGGFEDSLLSHTAWGHSVSTTSGGVSSDMGQNTCTTSSGCVATPLVTGACP